MIDLTRYWWPVATHAEFRVGKPLARRLHGIPLAIFRDTAGQPAALLDRCPHRHAPLSGGQVLNGELGCPYHGWRFAADGRCTAVPGLAYKAGQQPLVASYPTRPAHGLVWVCTSPDAITPPPIDPAAVDVGDSFFMTACLHCGLLEAVENFLDGFHTPFVHAGWIRSHSQRQTLTASVHRLPDGVEARYHGEGLQSGLISRLLESDRSISMGRFWLPGVAEIEYRGRHGLSLLVTVWFTPEDENQLCVHARVTTRRAYAPAWLKRALLSRLFGVILRQDKTILERSHVNHTHFKDAGLDVPMLDSPLDLLGPLIRRLLAGEMLTSADEKTISFRL